MEFLYLIIMDPLFSTWNFLLDVSCEFLPTLYHDILWSTVLKTKQDMMASSPGKADTFWGGIILGGGSEI